MVISVASGKGGTGKTTVATSLALCLDEGHIMDCDVEEPDSGLFIKPEITFTRPVYVPVPEIQQNRCNLCGKCREVCAYNAIAVLNRVLVFSELCHGCGACTYFCPQDAILEKNREIGSIETGRRNSLKFTHGKLGIGQAMAPPLIRAVKKYIHKQETTIIDAPPGTSCPVITAVRGSDFCLLVTEPTPFGLSDLASAAEVLKKLRIPCGVVVNRSNIGDGEVYKYCKQEKIPVLLEIPFSREIGYAYSRGIPVVEALPEYRNDFKHLLTKIGQMVKSDVQVRD
ncbi:MAG: ATP-binding protein [Spirochaetota bacterium]